MSGAGTALVLAGVALGGSAARAARRGRPRQAALFLVGLALLLRAYAAADPHLHEWDERYHALVAKNMTLHPLVPTLYDDPVLPYDSRDWLTGHVWLHKPPLALWSIAASIRLLGASEWAVRMPSVVLGALAVLLTVRLATLLFSVRVGLIAGFLHAVNGFLIELAAGRRATDHVDALFVVVIEAGVAVALGGLAGATPSWAARAAVVGALTGLAVLTKSAAGALVLLIWSIVAFSRLAPRAALALVALAGVVATIVAAPWFVYTARAFPVEQAWERAYELRHFFEVVEGHGGGPAFHLLQMPFVFGELVYVPLAWHTALALRRRDPRDVALLAWWAVPYVVFSAAATKMPGYVMVAAPALFVIVARFVEMVADLRFSGRPSRVARAVLVILLLGLPVRYAFERVRPFRSRPEPAWAAQLRALGATARPPCVLFGAKRPIEAMFYTPCAAYPHKPPAHERAALAARGYTVVDAP